MQATIVEYLREKMIQTAEEKGSLAHPDVIAISQRLDRFIVMLQRINLTMRTHAEWNGSTVIKPLETTGKHLVRFKRAYVNRFTRNTIKHSASSQKKMSS